MLPVFCLAACLAPPMNTRWSYFCRINFSRERSASSASIGMFGLTFCGLKDRFEIALPTFFMVYSHSISSPAPFVIFSPYLNLLIAPAIHTQRLDFGHVRANLAVEGGASYAEEYAQLSPLSTLAGPIACRDDYLRSNSPILVERLAAIWFKVSRSHDLTWIPGAAVRAFVVPGC